MAIAQRTGDRTIMVRIHMLDCPCLKCSFMRSTLEIKKGLLPQSAIF